VSPKLFQALVEHSPEAILLLDAAGVVSYANAATETVFGYSPAEAVGQRVVDWLHPEAMSGFSAVFESCLQSPRQLFLVSGYYKHRQIEDILLYGEARLSNHLDDSNTGGVLLYFREVPVERQAIEDWGRESSLQGPVINALPDQIFVKDRLGQLLTANDAALRARGCKSIEDLRGKTDFTFFTPELARRFERQERAVFALGKPVLNEEMFLPGEGGSAGQWLSVTRVPLRDPDGKVVGLVGISHEITRQKQAETELRNAKEAAEAASRAKDDFLRNMSHEMRTPLGAAMNMVELVLATPLAEDQSQCLQTAKAAADHLLGVIDDVLDFSKLRARKLELHPAPFSLRHAVSDTFGWLTPLATRRGLKLGRQVDSDVPERLVGDLKRLRQVLVNLIGNALKFTHEGEVALRVARVTEPASGLRREGEVWLRFEVRDTGIGIPEEKQRSIFDAFTQADSSTTRKYGGTGLGLAISASLVELLGGTIRVESAPGKGSRFHFTARFQPDTEPGPTPPVRPASEPPRTRALRILLAEDSEHNQQSVVRFLRKMGHTAAVVENGREALDALEREAFDLVLMDVQMPVLDGLDATRQQRARETDGKRVPIIALTAHAMPGDRERCLQAGADDYVTKPISFPELAGAIARVAGAGGAEDDPGFDEKQALARLDDDREMLRDDIKRFLASSPGEMAQLREAVARHDAEGLAKAAHKFVAHVGKFSEDGKLLSRRLEEEARGGDLDRAGRWLVELTALVERLQAALRRWLAKEGGE
jgi:PAS domain S-box-containing protein